MYFMFLVEFLNDRGWRDDSVGKVLALKAWGHELSTQNPCKEKKLSTKVDACNSSTGKGESDRFLDLTAPTVWPTEHPPGQ